ncbi:MAG: ACT domain-containing protein, partial [Euryarchaeota archaeon]|nr:ACT domain-containing protein [Euryarchaeota archaeon]
MKRKMEQITVIVENRPGALADVCEILGRNGINIRAISAEALGEGGIIRLITEDAESAKRALGSAWYKFIVSEVLPIKLPDKPGELAKVARKLANARINVECIYILGREKGTTEIALKVDKLEEARKTLKP